MSKLTSKILVAAAFAVTMSAANAAVANSADDSLASSAQSAIRQGVFTHSVRAQAIDGVVYLYGHTGTYPARVNIENAVKAAVPGHKVVSSIESSSYN